MQRTRDWRRKQWYLHNYRWPYTKYIRKGEKLHNVKHWEFRRREELGGQEIPKPDYNRIKFKSNSQQLIQEQLI